MVEVVIFRYLICRRGTSQTKDEFIPRDGDDCGIRHHLYAIAEDSISFNAFLYIHLICENVESPLVLRRWCVQRSWVCAKNSVGFDGV